MIDNEFDGFVNGKLGDHEVPVPAGLWDKLTNAQFDQFIGNKLKDNTAPVPEGAWDKIADGQFDGFIGNTLSGAEAAVPAGLWDRITDGQFDAFVSGKLSGYEAAVPVGLWDKVNPQQKDDDRGGFAWLRNPGRAIAVAAVLIALLGGYYWFQSSSNNNNTITVPDTASTTQPAQGSGDVNNGTTGDNNGSSGNSRNEAGSNTNAAPGTDNATGQLAQPSATPNTPGTSPDNRLNATQNGTQLSNDALSSNNNNITNRNGQRNGRRNGVAVGTGIADNGNNTNNAAMADNGSNNTTEANASSFDFVEPYQSNHLQSGTTIPFARNSYNSNLSDKHLTAGNHTNQLKGSIIVCPSDKGLNKDWFLEAYGSPDFAFSKVTSNGASQAYMDRKDSSESMNPGFSVGLRLVKPITEDLLLKAGLQYSQMNQKYVYRTENEIKTITVVSLRTIIRAPGDTVIVRDTSVLQQAGYKNNTVINRFRSLDVPITIGYQFGNDDWKIGINAGVVVNMSSWYEGVMLDTSLATVPITKGSNNSIYKSKIGLGLVGGISVMKKLSDDIQIFAEPYFRFNLSNTTTPNAPFNQKFSVGGISLGVRLNLNRQ